MLYTLRLEILCCILVVVKVYNNNIHEFNFVQVQQDRITIGHEYIVYFWINGNPIIIHAYQEMAWETYTKDWEPKEKIGQV